MDVEGREIGSKEVLVSRRVYIHTQPTVRIRTRADRGSDLQVLIVVILVQDLVLNYENLVSDAKRALVTSSQRDNSTMTRTTLTRHTE